MALYGRPDGQVRFESFLATVSDNSLQLAAAIMLPVLVAKVDPTDLGDGLAQVARLASLFRSDWGSMSRARRARSIADQGRIRHTLTMAFWLFVLSLRRGGRMDRLVPVLGAWMFTVLIDGPSGSGKTTFVRTTGYCTSMTSTPASPVGTGRRISRGSRAVVGDVGAAGGATLCGRMCGGSLLLCPFMSSLEIALVS